MNIHEYQAKELFKKYNVPTLRGHIAFTPDEAVKAAQELGGNIWVVKAQIHAGGRGLGGGVKLAKSTSEVREMAAQILGMQLVTHQTGPEGKLVQKVYIEEGADIKKEYYLGLLLDRALEMPIMMASTEGGMAIEEVAHNTPEKIIKVSIDPLTGFQSFHGRKLAFGLGLPVEEINTFIKFASALYKVYMDHDAEMIEINPLVKTGDGKFLALDAKMGFDNNALYRQSQVNEMRFERRRTNRNRSGNTVLAISNLTVTSVVWLMVPVLQWVRWIRSTTRAENRRISSMSAVLPVRKRWQKGLILSSKIRMLKRFS
jgi:succinyl-CoA synthetase beta subunit